MADRPMIFSAPMVRAMLDGRKTQTRRVLRIPNWVSEIDEIGDDGYTLWCASRESGCIAPALPQYLPHDRLWVREAWGDRYAGEIVYRADDDVRSPIQWRSPIHMPRWASRLTLTVTEVRVQRVQEISEADANAEGCDVPSEDQDWSACRRWFRDFWSSIYGPDAWDRNEWVAALTFTVERRNIDAPPLPHVGGA